MNKAPDRGQLSYTSEQGLMWGVKSFGIVVLVLGSTVLQLS